MHHASGLSYLNDACFETPLKFGDYLTLAKIDIQQTAMQLVDDFRITSRSEMRNLDTQLFFHSELGGVKTD